MLQFVGCRNVIFLYVLVLLVNSSMAIAGSFNAMPVRIDIRKDSQTGSTVITNLSNQPLFLQADLMSWSQNDGEDVLEPSNDLVLSPPIFKIKPNGAQTLRIGLLKARQNDVESAYRLMILEVPQDSKDSGVTINVALQIVLPLFVASRNPTLPIPAWDVIRNDDGSLTLSVSNSGGSHIHLIGIKLFDGNGHLLSSQNVNGYVLPGKSRKWNVMQNSVSVFKGNKVRLSVQTDDGDIETDQIIK